MQEGYGDRSRPLVVHTTRGGNPSPLATQTLPSTHNRKRRGARTLHLNHDQAIRSVGGQRMGHGPTIVQQVYKVVRTASFGSRCQGARTPSMYVLSKSQRSSRETCRAPPTSPRRTPPSKQQQTHQPMSSRNEAKVDFPLPGIPASTRMRYPPGGGAGGGRGARPRCLPWPCCQVTGEGRWRGALPPMKLANKPLGGGNERTYIHPCRNDVGAR